MRVVCINNGEIKDRASVCRLTLGKIYDYDVSYTFAGDLYIVVNNDDGDRHDYYRGRFITLKEYRKKKLNKIVSTYEKG